MAQHKQMAITQFKHKYQQILLEHTHKTEHHIPSSIIQIFTHISSYHIIKTTQFWVEENRNRKTETNSNIKTTQLSHTSQSSWLQMAIWYLRFCLPELPLVLRKSEAVRVRRRGRRDWAEMRECRSEGVSEWAEMRDWAKGEGVSEWGSVELSWWRRGRLKKWGITGLGLDCRYIYIGYFCNLGY